MFKGRNHRLIDIAVNDSEIKAFLTDGRTISVPLVWSWRLSEATEDQRQHYEIIGDGQGVHWPDIDEDISVEGMLYGVPARCPSPVATRIRANEFIEWKAYRVRRIQDL